ncbi:MAG TPA: hypothetical protein VHV10_12785 [Ktedonobacteraceae bacterium]|nr:hypothetical protein [Ktedonobacteraceae bacterium]
MTDHLGQHDAVRRGLTRRRVLLFVGLPLLIGILLILSLFIADFFRINHPSQPSVPTSFVLPSSSSPRSMLISSSLPSSPSPQSTLTSSSLANLCKQSGNVVDWPVYNPPPRVDPPNSDHIGNLSYYGGHVIDGIANVYLIFWIDAAFQPATPGYVSLVEQFVKDIGQSPLYANLLQYYDASGRCPASATLAGTFTDTRPFPQDLVTNRQSPNINSHLMDSLTDQTWRQEIAIVAAKQGWNTQDYHNVFVMLPTMSWGCGWHSSLSSSQQGGSPYIYGSYPSYQGQDQCVVVPQSPNHDHIADIATGIVSHELMEAVSDPYPGSGWDSSGGTGEMADKCPLPPSTIDPKTNGNVTWNGHSYAIQEEYDNYRHGCVLEGP